MQHNTYQSPITTHQTDINLSTKPTAAFESGLLQSEAINMRLDSDFAEPLRVNKNICNIPHAQPKPNASMKMGSMYFKSPIKLQNAYGYAQDES